eukprot:1129401-Ditylum_brightwellii.AAC.1
MAGFKITQFRGERCVSSCNTFKIAVCNTSVLDNTFIYHFNKEIIYKVATFKTTNGKGCLDIQIGNVLQCCAKYP